MALEGEATSFEVEYHDDHLYASVRPVGNADDPRRMVSSYLQLIECRYERNEDGDEFIAFAVDGADRMRAMLDGLLQDSLRLA